MKLIVKVRVLGTKEPLGFEIQNNSLSPWLMRAQTNRGNTVVASNGFSIDFKANRNDAIRQGKILFVSREIVYFMACIVK